jgi:uncharacterized protein YaiI (UPF0178 family)
MRIWVDADACPNPIKEIVFRAANRLRLETTLVANHALRTPPSLYIKSLQVEHGFDVADARILQLLSAGDLVITADIPLAAEVIKADARALNPRGTLYTAENISEHLARRNLMDQLRSAGTMTGGPPTLAKTDLQAFANAFDRVLPRPAKPPAMS